MTEPARSPQKRIAIVGARGYTGGALIPIILKHPGLALVAVGSKAAAGSPVRDAVEDAETCELVFSDLTPETLEQLELDACILALPNGASQPFIDAVQATRSSWVLVDLSADHRFDASWAYGQPERFFAQIQGHRRISNPGCYATGGQLALDPILDHLEGTPVIFGVSGVSGAGKKPNSRNDPDRVQDNLQPYALSGHVHEREMSHHLGRSVRFSPHVAPFFRGISLTLSCRLQIKMEVSEILELFRQRYRSDTLVKIVAEIPEVKDIRETHEVIIGGFDIASSDPLSLTFVCVLDNLLKGAATQAIQNLNLSFGFEMNQGIFDT